MQLDLLSLVTILADNNPDMSNGVAGALAAFSVVWILLFIGLLVLSLVINWKVAQPVTRELRQARAPSFTPRT
jgi:hypothetical protein